VCAHAVRVAIEKIPGVEKVDVSLNDGVAIIRLAAGNEVTVAQVRRMIRDKGFTPKDAQLRLRGRVEAREGGFVLLMPGPDRSYRLSADPTLLSRLREAAGLDVVIEGRMPQDGAGDVSPSMLEVSNLIRRPSSDRPPNSFTGSSFSREEIAFSCGTH